MTEANKFHDDIKKDVTLAKDTEVVAGSTSETLSWADQLFGLKQSFRAAAASFACSSAAVLVGYDMNIIGSIIANKEFIQQFGIYHDSLDTWALPANRQLVWTLCQFVAAIFGAVIVGQVSDILGRRICFITTIG